MSIYYSKRVLKGLNEYKKALVSYPILKERAIRKTNAMKVALSNVAQSPTSNPICTQQDLGQKIVNGKPLIQTLRRFNYKDESGFQWAFSYIILGENILYTRMLPSRFVVKESLLSWIRMQSRTKSRQS